MCFCIQVENKNKIYLCKPFLCFFADFGVQQYGKKPEEKQNEIYKKRRAHTPEYQMLHL